MYDSEYVLNVVEQPQQCRISGSGEKDRRPIDPAPIIRLSLLHSNDHIEKYKIRKKKKKE